MKTHLTWTSILDCFGKTRNSGALISGLNLNNVRCNWPQYAVVLWQYSCLEPRILAVKYVLNITVCLFLEETYVMNLSILLCWIHTHVLSFNICLFGEYKYVLNANKYCVEGTYVLKMTTWVCAECTCALVFGC